MTKFLREPPQIRTAARVIVAATLVIVVGGGILFRALDSKEYPSIWTGLWLALQTVTTVGYGDVAPKDPAGRIVAAFLMLDGIAFLAIVTAAITSTFVARAARERFASAEDTHDDEESRVDARFDDLTQQLNRLESKLDRLAEPRPG
jgi:voltage-gated potassium channel